MNQEHKTEFLGRTITSGFGPNYAYYAKCGILSSHGDRTERQAINSVIRKIKKSLASK